MGACFNSFVFRNATDATSARSEFAVLQGELRASEGTGGYSGSFADASLKGVMEGCFASRAAALEHVADVGSKRDAWLCRFMADGGEQWLVAGWCPE